MTETISIKVRAGIGFEDLFPATSQDHSQAPETVLEMEAGTCLDAVADAIGLNSNERFMTALNDNIVVKGDRVVTLLRDGDVVEILPPLVGG